jgi:hypothetical protein
MGDQPTATSIASANKRDSSTRSPDCWCKRSLAKWQAASLPRALAEASVVPKTLLPPFGSRAAFGVPALSLNPIYRNTIHRDTPFKAGDDPQQWGPKIAEGLLAWKPVPRHEQADEFIKTLDLDEFDKSLDRIERMDAMIDRTIKRLMQLKTMKQMYSQLEPKLIDVSATKNLPAPAVTERPPTE